MNSAKKSEVRIHKFQELDCSAETSRRMAKVRQKDTAPEIKLRKELFRRGLRYRINFSVLQKPRRVADIAFLKHRVAVFVDGCFWHGCPEHGTWPKNNAEFWRMKIETNRLRDIDTNTRLEAQGWRVIRVWEHQSIAESASVVEKVLALPIKN